MARRDGNRAGMPASFLSRADHLESGNLRTSPTRDELSSRPIATEPRGPMPMLPDQDGQSTRLRSLDAYRGFIMLAMASGGAGMLAGFIDNGESFGSSLVHL